ncbi:MAG TPA: twin-arginine translocase TatA/TatE family subunit [Aeromicrobium sp.]|nr:twin-arginine translocase TatA/TatE family subunit [Aeromicrobium sp.]
MPSWLGGPEILIILAVILLIFGGRKLPELARGSGRALRIFKSEMRESEKESKIDATEKEPEALLEIDTAERRDDTPA